MLRIRSGFYEFAFVLLVFVMHLKVIAYNPMNAHPPRLNSIIDEFSNVHVMNLSGAARPQNETFGTCRRMKTGRTLIGDGGAVGVRPGCDQQGMWC